MKNNNVVVYVLGLLLAISLGYIAYDKFFSNNKIEENNTQNVVDNNKIDGNDDQDIVGTASKGKYIQHIDNRGIASVNIFNDVYVDTNGQVYFTINESGYFFDDNAINAFKTLYTNTGMKYYVGSTEEEVKAFKVDIENVRTVFVSALGNGGYEYIFAIKNDGTVSRIKLDYDDDGSDEVIVENNYGDLKNITNVINQLTFGVVDVMFIDSNGEQFIVE